MDVLDRVRRLVKRSRYRLSVHAESEREADAISIAELEEALGSSRLELLEDYPEDPRGHSHLLLGFTSTDRPIHVVCSIHEQTLVIITVYHPDPALWQNHRARRRKGK